MPTIRASKYIERSPADVFRFVGNQENAVRWQSGLTEVRRITSGPIGVGSRHAFVRKLMGRTMVAENEYVAYEPNQTVTFKTVSGPMDLQASYVVVPSGSGAELTCTMDLVRGRGLSGLFLPLISRSIQKQMTADFVTLKTVLELERSAESHESEGDT